MTVSLNLWLLEFHEVWFSGTSDCLLILDWLLSSFWLYKEEKDFYPHLLLSWNSHFSKESQRTAQKETGSSGMDVSIHVQSSCRYDNWKAPKTNNRFCALMLPGVSKLLGSLHHTGRRRVVLGHTLNTVTCNHKKKFHNVLSKFKILCWAAGGRPLNLPADQMLHLCPRITSLFNQRWQLENKCTYTTRKEIQSSYLN